MTNQKDNFISEIDKRIAYYKQYNGGATTITNVFNELQEFRKLYLAEKERMKEDLETMIDNCGGGTDYEEGQRDGFLWSIEYLDGEHRQTKNGDEVKK